MGDGDDPVLLQRIRAQGNFSEYGLFGLVLKLVAEAQGGPSFWLHLCGALLVAGRAMHGINFNFGLRRMPLREGGMVLTIVAITLAANVALPL